ncbi:MAG: hypothetical protein IPG96_01610 [Proteobacteria bacterium]|jgi:ribosome-binding factor A|nr:hypothetical protein [Pseudomonadota bacterium]
MRDPKRQLSDPPCEELCPDDGVDPRILFRRETRAAQHSRKDGQLCKQAFQALSLVLDQLGAEAWARGMYLVAVRPAPDASRLSVSVAFTEARTFEDAEQALQRLRALKGRLRWELAATLSRKRVPELAIALAVEEGDDDQR